MITGTNHCAVTPKTVNRCNVKAFFELLHQVAFRPSVSFMAPPRFGQPATRGGHSFGLWYRWASSEFDPIRADWDFCMGLLATKLSSRTLWRRQQCDTA